MSTIRGFITRLLCTHDYVRIWKIVGHNKTDEHGFKSYWQCKHCAKRVYSVLSDEISK